MPDDDFDAIPWEGYAGLAGIAPAWRTVSAGARCDALCNSFEWTELYARAYVPSGELFGWVLSDGGSPVGILAFRREPSRSRFALRRVLFAVDGSFDSDYLDFPALPGYEGRVARAALSLLEKSPEFEAVVLSCIPDDSPTLPVLRAATAERKLPKREIGVHCCASPLAKAFEDYLNSLKPRVRSKVRQAVRLCDQANARFAWYRDPATVHDDLECLYQLHAMRWRAVGHGGSFVDPCRRHFYNILSPAFLDMDRLRFAHLDIGGRTVASQIGVLAQGSYYQLQEGFDTEFADLRVATALRAHMIRDLMAEGVQTYDFMAGESRHKTEWGAVSRPCTSLAFALPRARARAAYGARAVVDWWRSRRAASTSYGATSPVDSPAEEN